MKLDQFSKKWKGFPFLVKEPRRGGRNKGSGVWGDRVWQSLAPQRAGSTCLESTGPSLSPLSEGRGTPIRKNRRLTWRRGVEMKAHALNTNISWRPCGKSWYCTHWKQSSWTSREHLWCPSQSKHNSEVPARSITVYLSTVKGKAKFHPFPT